MCIDVHVYMYIMCICVHVYMYMYVYMCTCTYICTSILLCTCIVYNYLTFFSSSEIRKSSIISSKHLTILPVSLAIPVKYL